MYLSIVRVGVLALNLQMFLNRNEHNTADSLDTVPKSVSEIE